MERRRHARVTLPAPRQAEADLGQEVQILEVSLGGARLEHTGMLRPGEPCVLRVPLEDRVVVVRSRVMWSRVLDRRAGRRRGDLAFHSGLAFEALPAGAQPLLAALVGTHPAEGTEA